MLSLIVSDEMGLQGIGYGKHTEEIRKVSLEFSDKDDLYEDIM
jgi:hypothetical protein